MREIAERQVKARNTSAVVASQLMNGPAEPPIHRLRSANRWGAAWRGAAAGEPSGV